MVLLVLLLLVFFIVVVVVVDIGLFVFVAVVDNYS